jgi:drug/metabolite transporter (DMT)-like permease
MIKNYALLLGIGFIWGSQFIFQQIAIVDVPPVWVGTARTLIGFLTLYILCGLLSLKGSRKNIKSYALIGLLEACIPFALIPWGQQYLSSSISAILMGTVPFFAIIVTPLLIAGARIRFGELAGVIVGFAGLLALFYPQLTGGNILIDYAGAIAILIAAACFATALVLLKRIEKEHPLIVARNVLGMASVQILIFALIVSPTDKINLNASSFLALVYLGVMCAGLVYFLYMALISRTNAVFASMSNYLVPAFGVLIGATIGAESIAAMTWISLAIILSAIGISRLLTTENPA